MEAMKMYCWDSVALKDYRNGTIIVIANNVMEARALVMAEAMTNRETADKLAVVERDISAKPETKTVLFITGTA